MKGSWLSLSFLLLCSLVSAQDIVTVQQFIALALEKNYDIKIARNALEASTVDRAYASGLFLPQLNAIGSLGRNVNNQELEFQDPARNNSGQAVSNNTSASIQLNWVLFDGMRMFATYNRLNALNVQNEFWLKDQMTNTVATVINNYYDIVRQKQQLMALQEQMAVSQERVKLAEKKLQVGTGSKPELLQARVDYNSQRTQALQQEALIRQLKEQMRQWVGEELTPGYEVSDSIPLTLMIDGADFRNETEKTNYTLRSLQTSVEVARYTVRENKADIFPIISLTGNYNYNQTDNIKLINPFGTLFNRSHGYNYAVNVTLPLFNGFAVRRNIQLAQVNLTRQQLIFDQQKLVVNVLVESALVNYENARKILAIEEETILLAKENVFIALESFKRGIGTFIELRTAQQSLADAYNRLIAARFSAKTAETELLRLRGSLIQ